MVNLGFGRLFIKQDGAFHLLAGGHYGQCGLRGKPARIGKDVIFLSSLVAEIFCCIFILQHLLFFHWPSRCMVLDSASG